MAPSAALGRRGERRLEGLAVWRVEELEYMCARRPAGQYLHWATDPDRHSRVRSEVVVSTWSSDLDVAIEHDDRSRAPMAHRSGAAARLPREPNGPERMSTLRLTPRYR